MTLQTLASEGTRPHDCEPLTGLEQKIGWPRERVAKAFTVDGPWGVTERHVSQLMGGLGGSESPHIAQSTGAK